MRLTKRQVLSAAAGALVAPSIAEAEIGENKMSVYTIYNDNSADEASDNHGYLNEMLDGDFKSAFPVGYEFHPVTKAARLEDGTRIKQSAAYQGLPVDMSGLPKRIRWGGASAIWMICK